jgi:hypothetical protein
MNEVCPSTLFRELASPFPSSPLTHKTYHPPSIPLLPPPIPLHVRSSNCNRRLLPPKIAAHPSRAPNGQTPRDNLLVPVAILSSARVRELYQDGREV